MAVSRTRRLATERSSPARSRAESWKKTTTPMVRMARSTEAKARSSFRPTGMLFRKVTGEPRSFSGSEGVGQGADEAALVAFAQRVLVGVVPADVDGDAAGEPALHAGVPGGVFGARIGDPLAHGDGGPGPGVDGDAALGLQPPRLFGRARAVGRIVGPKPHGDRTDVARDVGLVFPEAVVVTGDRAGEFLVHGREVEL